jgi:alanine dehydrogenase
VDRQTVILTADDVDALLDMDGCIAAVENGFRLLGLGKAPAPAVLGVHVSGGGFHIKAATVELSRPYFVAKTNGNFPQNPSLFGLPTIQGVLVLSDAADGRLLAVMDSMRITELRTAAATGVAISHLAPRSASTVTLIGCGAQAASQLLAVKCVRDIDRAFVIDSDPGRAEAFADAMGPSLGFPISTPANAQEAMAASQIIVTCTPSHSPIIGPEDISPGTTIAAVGADNPEKVEIHPELMARSRVVVDSLEQAAAFGDLKHAITAEVMTQDDVHGSLPDIVAGKLEGRTSDDQIMVFDSTGIAIQDVMSAVSIFERAIETGRGTVLRFG